MTLDDEIEAYLSGTAPESEPIAWNINPVIAKVIAHKIGDDGYAIHISEIVDAVTGEVLQDYDNP